MDKTHPDDAELLAYVDDELASERRRDLAAHLEACPDCADSVAKLETGRDALRAAPLLQLPPTMRERVSMTLDRFGPDARRPAGRTYVSQIRLVTILAPVAVALALVVTVAELAGDDDREREAGATATESAQAGAEGDAGGGEESARARGATGSAGADAPTATILVSSLAAEVVGPPSDVVRVLRRAGLDARVAGRSRVAVEGASADEIQRALAGRRRGRVEVVVPEP